MRCTSTRNAGLAVLALTLLHCPLAAEASALAGSALDTAADYIAWFVLIVMPPAAIALFWIVHVLPQKAAEKRQHPQKEAIHVLCLLSLVFGGLLWPFAWLWAYTRPTAYALTHGTEKHEDHYLEQAERAEKGQLAVQEIEALCHELDGIAGRGLMTPRLHEARSRLARVTSPPPHLQGAV
jgi:CBS domain containing-hemolysin-like protein